MRASHSAGHLLPLAALLLAAAGCVKETTAGGGAEVVRDMAFVGYSNPDTKMTTCGNCHIDRQHDWQATKHANAWTDLQASGHAVASCDVCHTTNGRTNLAADSAGYFSVSASSKSSSQRPKRSEAC